MNGQANVYRERLLMKCEPDPNSGCWLWTGALQGSGYGHMIYEGRNIGAHRLSYRLFVGEVQPGEVVCHRCDTRACVNPAHLWAGSHSNNLKDCRDKGRLRPGRFPGEANPRALLSEADVIAIRATPALRGYRQSLAARYGVAVGTIKNIRSGRIWQHLPVTPEDIETHIAAQRLEQQP